MALEINSYFDTTTMNNHHYKQFPFTIIPILEDALNKTNVDITKIPASTQKPPDLTFHCMCCEEYFISPFLMYEHLNTKHADLPKPQESEEELDDNKDYSWVFEPVCELVAPEEGAINEINDPGAEEGAEVDSDSDDSESGDDSSTSSSSSSSSSDSSTNSNSNTNTEDELTRDSVTVNKVTLTMNDSTTMEVIEEGAYEEVESASFESQNNSIQLKVADPRESTSIILLNHSVADITIPPLLAQPVRRGRGRRSAAQQAAIEMSSLICGEPKCFQCSHCEASFPSAGDLSKHVRCHITNKPFQCSICEKTFTHIGSLNTHIRIHSGEKPYKCELCSKAFTQSSSLMVHLKSHSIKKPHQCHLCDKGFVNSTSLVIHLKTHKYGSRYSCSECDKSFKHEAQLKEHMRMHKQTLVYQCSICRNAFASSSELVQHMKWHMGEKPFTCSICDRSFTQSGSLNIHMRIHTGEKPFNCKLCNKSFTQASSLSVHMKIHSGEKPFPCHMCGKSYSQAAYLNKHIQHHIDAQKQGLDLACPVPNERLLCIVCGDLHRDAASLALHVTQRHATLLHNMEENQQFNNAENSDEERLQQEQQYIQQMQLLMQIQQQMMKRTQKQEQQNSQQLQAMVEEENKEGHILVQKPQHVKENDNEHPEEEALEDNESDAENQQNIEPLKNQKEETEEYQEKIEEEEDDVYAQPRVLLSNRNSIDSYTNGSDLEDEAGMNIKMFNANSSTHLNHNVNNCFMNEVKDIEMSEYPFLEGAEYDDYDDYAAEEEVETEE